MPEPEVFLSTASDTAELTPWYLPESRFEELPGVLCATDLLAAWQPDSLTLAPGVTEGWDAYLPALEDGRAGYRAITHFAAEPTPAEPWNPLAAAAAADTLFRFLHALERCDIDAAMLSISPGFSTIEKGAEIDRLSLRTRLERFADEWRGPELRVTLTEIPDPMFFPRGLVLRITLQVDHRDKNSGELRTLLLPYLLHFDSEPNHDWLIQSMYRLL